MVEEDAVEIAMKSAVKSDLEHWRSAESDYDEA